MIIRKITPIKDEENRVPSIKHNVTHPIVLTLQTNEQKQLPGETICSPCVRTH